MSAVDSTGSRRTKSAFHQSFSSVGANISPSETVYPDNVGASFFVEATDAELVLNAQGGDRDAMQELMSRYQRRVLAVVVGMLRNQDDALEVVQETFIRAFRNLVGFKGDSSFYTWVYRIAVNLAIDHKRRQSKRGAVEFDETLPPSEDAIGEGGEHLARDPYAKVRDRELGKRIFEAIEGLTPNHRAVILLREVEGLSYEEISEVLECSIGTVMSRLHYARKKLQERLTETL
jgi:RNA polymerase sigma-70 factor (ECF subfamily)